MPRRRYIANARRTLLSRIEGVIKSNPRYLAKGGGWLLGGQVAAAAISIGVGVAFANLLPKELYGNYKYILSVVGILTAFTLSGVALAVPRSVAHGASGTIRLAFRINFLSHLVVTALSALIAGYYLFQGNDTLGWSLLIAGLIQPFLTSAMLAYPYLQGMKDFRASSISYALQATATSLATIVTLALTDSIIALVSVFFISQALWAALIFRSAMLRHPPNSTVDRDILRYGSHLSIMTMVATFVGELDKIFLFQFMGGSQVAVYAFATALPTQLRGVMKNVYTLAVPSFAERTHAEVRAMLFHKTVVMFIVCAGMVVAYCLAAPLIFKLLFPQYLDAIWYTQLYSLTLLFAPQLLLTAFMESHRLLKERYITSAINMGSFVILMFVLGMWYGITGIILAKIISQALNTAASVILIRRM